MDALNKASGSRNDGEISALPSNTEFSATNSVTTIRPSLKNSILVNIRQRGNPILKFIRTVAWEYAEVVPDYVLGQTTCALFLSIRYHNLHPDYIHERLKEIRNAFNLRILLLQIDVEDPYPILKSLTHISLLADLTIIPAYSAEEAGRILENYKIYENKPADFLLQKQDPEIKQQVIESLTSIRQISKTDAQILLNKFGSLEEILKATPEKFEMLPGFGTQKAEIFFGALHETFKIKPKPN